MAASSPFWRLTLFLLVRALVSSSVSRAVSLPSSRSHRHSLRRDVAVRDAGADPDDDADTGVGADADAGVVENACIALGCAAHGAHLLRDESQRNLSLGVSIVWVTPLLKYWWTGFPGSEFISPTTTNATDVGAGFTSLCVGRPSPSPCPPWSAAATLAALPPPSLAAPLKVRLAAGPATPPAPSSPSSHLAPQSPPPLSSAMSFSRVCPNKTACASFTSSRFGFQ